MSKPVELVKAELIEMLCTRYGYPFEEASALGMDTSILRHINLMAMLAPRPEVSYGE